jgi:hypothetical protein
MTPARCSHSPRARALPEHDSRSTNSHSRSSVPSIQPRTSPKSTSASAPGGCVCGTITTATPRGGLRLHRGHERAHRGLAHLGAVLVDQPLPDPGARYAAVYAAAVRQRPTSPGSPPDTGPPPAPNDAASAAAVAPHPPAPVHRPPMHLMSPRQPADRHPFLPTMPSDTFEQLHPRPLPHPYTSAIDQSLGRSRT